VARRTQPASVPPTMSPQQAIPLLKRQLQRLQEVKALPFNDPRNDGWYNTTQNILNSVYGMPNGEMHRNTKAFSYADSGIPLRVNMSDEELQADYVGRQERREALLLAFIEQLQDLAPPVAGGPVGEYRFHPEIEAVSGELIRDGHYKQAALEAYIRVIEEVKRVSALPLDGDSLMNRSFGFENQEPTIKFNLLQTDPERDEQRGILYLFKGIVGLRNSKAHSNRIFNDPFRAHDYLALASLLLRLLEIRIRTS
jgi:uncharacterized protein (TIGR02391 family)